MYTPHSHTVHKDFPHVYTRTDRHAHCRAVHVHTVVPEKGEEGAVNIFNHLYSDQSIQVQHTSFVTVSCATVPAQLTTENERVNALKRGRGEG